MIKHEDGLDYLKSLKTNSVDLVLTDPPYQISRETGMQHARDNGLGNAKFHIQTKFGEWDEGFEVAQLEPFIKEIYRVLKKGGTLICFYDLWKISFLAQIFKDCKFKQLRFIEWIKTNPQPLNSSVNYLTNCREIALVAVKGGKPTFNSKYDNGIYQYPLQGGKNRFHPTQKSLALFEDLIKKHSNENDTVLDTFLGGGTTAIACKNTKRNFKGCEISKEYYDKVKTILEI